MEPIISLKNLTKEYGTLKAVNALHLDVFKGEVFGLLGPNGAGKSTTILMMLGLTEPTTGTVSVCGYNATINPIEVKKKVGYLPDSVGFYDNRTGLENLVYVAQLNGISEKTAAQKAKELLERVGLEDVMHKKVSTYSRGMKQRLGLADVLIKNPEVIVLDEPTLGIDPKGVKDFLYLIRRLSREEQLTVLLSSHHLHQVQQVCDRVGIFVNGELLAEGDIASLSKQLFAEEAYVVEVQLEEDHKTNFLTIEKLLLQLKAVNGVQLIDDKIEVACTSDSTAAITKTLVNANFSMVYLHKRTHGLDDIYQRYFEHKNESHQQTA